MLSFPDFVDGHSTNNYSISQAGVDIIMRPTLDAVNIYRTYSRSQKAFNVVYEVTRDVANAILGFYVETQEANGAPFTVNVLFGDEYREFTVRFKNPPRGVFVTGSDVNLVCSYLEVINNA